jgi:NTE family protein
MLTDVGTPAWVFGGGGVAGIAWETGVLAGLADQGVFVAASDIVVGTSAGAVVGAQVTGGVNLETLYQRQHSSRPSEVSPNLTLSAIWRLATASLLARSAEQVGRRLGRLAIAAAVEDPELLLRVVADRLPGHEWPEADLRITAVDAESGESRVFTRADGAPLIDVVAASCCIPFLYSPIRIGGRRYIDGGIRSPLNLDLAPGSGPVIALAPNMTSIGRWGKISGQRAMLGDRRVEVVTRDDASRRAQGRKIMDRSVLPALVAAGREQGRSVADRVRVALESR